MLQFTNVSDYAQTIPPHSTNRANRKHLLPPCNQHRFSRQTKRWQPKGCYVILTINHDSSITNKDAVQVEFIRFDYDVEKAAKEWKIAHCQMSMQTCFEEVISQGHLVR